MKEEIELHSKYMLFYCRKICNNIEEAKDLLHEVILHLLEKVSDKYDKTKDFIAWVRIVIRRVYFNNRYGRNVKKTIYNTKQKNTIDSEEFQIFSEHYLIVKSDAIDKLIVQDIEKIISKLPDRIYKIFKMLSEGYDYDSIAIELGVSKQNINSTIHNYRKKIKEEFNT